MTREEQINEIAFATLRDVAQSLPNDTNFSTIKLISSIIIDRARLLKDYTQEELNHLFELINLD